MVTPHVYHTIALEKLLQDWIKESASSKESIAEIIMKTVFEKLMEAERNAFMKHEYNAPVAGDGNKRNGYYSRMVEQLSGTFTLRVPRDRYGQFEPMILQIIKQEHEKVDELAYTLYTKGLPTRDVGDVLKKLYGTSCSPQSISNITASFQKTRESWQKRTLQENWYAIYIDAIHMPIRRHTVENEAIYVVFGLKPDLTREIIGLYNVPQESASGWEEVFCDIKARGVKNVLLFAADGLTGLGDVVNRVFPNSRFQSCVLHKERNVLKKVRVSDRKEIGIDIKAVFNLNLVDDTKEAALLRLDEFLEKWGDRYHSFTKMFDERQRASLFTYLEFPFSIRRMIYTTNWIERLNRDIRKGTRQRLSFPNPDSALNLIWAIVVDREEKTYRYPVTAFLPVKDELDDRLTEMYGVRNTKKLPVIEKVS
jgi:putative transposase